eukprot:TRINITY_DN2313_c0_g1_i10.p1 TRINITY_DN2313_c0_g1~~TRINITY_DN2313_c0_g1_i10.p1  ORF type:complete len:121 (+),score=2.23 TRINITY_DN2313_c0_g1_i10:160-522(+)
MRNPNASRKQRKARSCSSDIYRNMKQSLHWESARISACRASLCGVCVATRKVNVGRFDERIKSCRPPAGKEITDPRRIRGRRPLRVPKSSWRGCLSSLLSRVPVTLRSCAACRKFFLQHL